MLSQIVRYGLVGMLVNLMGYLIYLLITWLWLEPRLSITLLYPIGAVTAYFGHARYSFIYNGRHSHGIVRYIIAQLSGYGVNIAMQSVFFDWLKYPHQLVQAVAIVVVASTLFLLFRYFVFPNRLPN